MQTEEINFENGEPVSVGEETVCHGSIKIDGLNIGHWAYIDNKNKPEYEPYGKKWRAYVKKWPKDRIIDQFRSACIEARNKKEHALEFTEWYRNGLLYIEHDRKSIEELYEDFLIIKNKQNNEF